MYTISSKHCVPRVSAGQGLKYVLPTEGCFSSKVILTLKAPITTVAEDKY